ncbi:hypothetical protein ACFWY5_45730 [Nonomuraea sp. NPDC059007]|uniref:hypothetical protein n=1 Tax=Nonomuraea sp. NPDC059007 TaxID=3346692 RepID=UPI0036B108D8
MNQPTGSEQTTNTNRIGPVDGDLVEELNVSRQDHQGGSVSIPEVVFTSDQAFCS